MGSGGTGAEPPAKSDVFDVFDADDEIGADLARVDWAATPLGPPEQWQQSLRTTVGILLSSRFSMWMAWGPELTFFCNAAYRRDTLGRKYPWALGRRASEVWAEIWADIGPRIEAVLSTGEATWDEALLLFVERSGYVEESYHTFSYSPVRDDAGEVVGMLCVVSEDTDRVIGERRMATLRDLGSDPTVIRTEEQVLAFASSQIGRNPRDLPFTLAYLFDEGGTARLAGSTGLPAGHPAAPAVVVVGDPAAAWPAAEVADGDQSVVDLVGDRFADLPTGGRLSPPTQALVVPLRRQGSTPYGFLVAGLNRYRDLDDAYRGFVDLVAGHLAAGVASARSFQAQQRRAEELAELDRAKTAFFSNVSHEFRTPLTLIWGRVPGRRARGAALDEAVRAELDVVHRNGLRLSKLVNALLDFSRIEAGRMQAEYEPTDLAVLTGELAGVFRSAVEKAGLDYVVTCAPLNDPVHLDRGMWEKVVFNLLSNAVKFTFDGSIRVTVDRDGEHAVVTVTDTGVGVAAEEIPRLFERFHRIENTRARSNEGSGIGLALVRELVELHGGEISARSAPGEGTTFTVRLPFGVGHLPPGAIVPAGTGTGNPTTAEQYVVEALRWLPGDTGSTEQAGPSDSTGEQPSARVLVADDNADMREYLSRLLTGAGYRVGAVTDGGQALDVVRADPPDLVISDVMMPVLDGLALVAKLRADPRTAAVPVLLLSARAGEEAAVEGLQAGADDYLIKPFAAVELLARVRANVELARLRTHHARWRTALVDSLQEAFFVVDEAGAVVEINAAFTEIIGFDVAGLPYQPVHPWWPDAETDPEAHRQAGAAFAGLLARPQGRFTTPVRHRDGHRLWVAVTFNHVQDPDTGRRVAVATFRDVTAEHYTVQRQAALAALNQQLAQADTVAEALTAAVAELRRVWEARRVVGATFALGPSAEPVEVESVEVESAERAGSGAQAQWRDLPAAVREEVLAVRDGDPLVVAARRPGTAGIALQHPRGTLVVWIELVERRPFTPEDETLLIVLAGRLGQGLARVHQVDQQRETALALQHAILGPQLLPAGFAVRYQTATRPLQVGGDWYDLVELDDGRIALVVGDCVGHGLGAATVMGQLRSACRALLLENPSPAAALSGLDRFAARLPGAECTTVFCAVLDPATAELVYSCAGHPPPILVRADGAAETLEDGRTIPIGLRTDHPRSQARRVIPPRATLLLYTDGLVERRRSSVDVGIGLAAEVVQGAKATALEDLASDLMSGLSPAGGYEDDVALLLYREPAPLELRFPGDTSHIGPTRHALHGWLDRCGLTATQTDDILIAVGEAVTNAVEHGHRDTPEGTVTLRCTALVDHLDFTVTDTGTWKQATAAPGSHRGRGLMFMRALVAEVGVHTGPSGTTVHMRADLAP